MSRMVVRRVQNRAEIASWGWVCAAEEWLAAHQWGDAVLFAAMVGCWGGGWALLLPEGPPRLQIAAAGVLFVIGGVCELFLAGRLSEWRNNTPWLGRIATEGAWGSVEYTPNSYRFFGSAVAGFGVGAAAWAIWPRWDFSISCGLVSCLVIWVCTWFAFPANAND